jgi:hypothetical protein
MFGRGFLEPSFRSIIRDMERTMNHLYQDVGRNFNQAMLPRAIPHASLADDQKPMYRLNVDRSGFKPEEIKSIEILLKFLILYVYNCMCLIFMFFQFH